MDDKITVMIVDDEPLIRKAIKYELNERHEAVDCRMDDDGHVQSKEIEVLDTFASGPQLFAALNDPQRPRPDYLLVDIAVLPRIDFLRASRDHSDGASLLPDRCRVRRPVDARRHARDNRYPLAAKFRRETLRRKQRVLARFPRPHDRHRPVQDHGAQYLPFTLAVDDFRHAAEISPVVRIVAVEDRQREDVVLYRRLAVLCFRLEYYVPVADHAV